MWVTSSHFGRDISLRSAGKPGEVAGEPGRVECIRPGDHRRVERAARLLERLPIGIRGNRPGMPTSGLGTSVNRLIHMRSAQSRWLSVLWMEPKNAPRSRRRSSSGDVSAAA